MLLDTRNDSWVFRRDPRITGPIAALGRTTDSGIPYLSPEIQFLYKARRETLGKDDADPRDIEVHGEAALLRRLPVGKIVVVEAGHARGEWDEVPL